MLKINPKLRQCLLKTYSEHWLNHMPMKAEIHRNVTNLEARPKMRPSVHAQYMAGTMVVSLQNRHNFRGTRQARTSYE